MFILFNTRIATRKVRFGTAAPEARVNDLRESSFQKDAVSIFVQILGLLSLITRENAWLPQLFCGFQQPFQKSTFSEWA